MSATTGEGPLYALMAQWQAHAGLLRAYGDERGAAICEKHAAELLQAIRETDAEVLTLSEAASVSGYSADHIRALVASGAIPNAGRRNRPRVRRGDLPRKPPTVEPPLRRRLRGYSVEDDVAQVTARLSGRPNG